MTVKRKRPRYSAAYWKAVAIIDKSNESIFIIESSADVYCSRGCGLVLCRDGLCVERERERAFTVGAGTGP